MGDTRQNMDIRLAAAGSGLYLWQIAEKLGINEYSFSRKLRHELPAEEKEKVMEAIRELSASEVKA